MNVRNVVDSGTAGKAATLGEADVWKPSPVNVGRASTTHGPEYNTIGTIAERHEGVGGTDQLPGREATAEALIQKPGDAEPCNQACEKQLLFPYERLGRWFHRDPLIGWATVRNVVTSGTAGLVARLGEAVVPSEHSDCSVCPNHEHRERGCANDNHPRARPPRDMANELDNGA